MTTVSIILPTWNSTRIIRPTLESVFAQTFTDYELLIVDDGSTDNTVAYAEQIDDPRIKVFAYPNAGVGGPSAGRNRGLQHATGEFVALLNHDDLWSPNKLAAQIEALRENRHAMVAYSWLDHVDLNGDYVHRGSCSVAQGDILHELLLGNFIETGSNPLIRREAFDVVGGFDASFRIVADWEMWLRLATRFQFAVVPEVQVFFRDMPNALSANTVKMEQDALRLFEHTFSRLPAVLQPLRRKTMANFYEYLASRTLKGDPSAEKVQLALNFLNQSIRNDPMTLWTKRRRVISVLAKAFASVVLPPKQMEAAMTVYRKRFA